MQADFQHLKLDQLFLSQTTAQVERRAHFDKAGLKELAGSLTAVGMLQPLVVRPISNGRAFSPDQETFEIVAGERRFVAAKQAGLETVPVNVRNLSDEQVLEVQLVENLQREGLHELAEAEGYEGLMKLGFTADQVAEKCGRSKAYVYARLKLTALCKAARAAFYDGKLDASKALLIARIPEEDAQQRALKVITEVNSWNGRTMTYREASEYVRDNFMLKLSDAPFPREDATLVPSAGPCGACPMRTGNQPELFGDVKGADVCTNPGCFKEKKVAFQKRELEKAKSSGVEVIRGSEAKRILPTRNQHYYDSSVDPNQLRNGYARPSDKCNDDPKKRTFAELAGKDAPTVLLQNPDSGKVQRVFRIADITDRLKLKGIKPKPPAKDRTEQREQDQETRKQREAIELAARGAILRAVMAAAPVKLAREDLVTLVCELGRDFDHSDNLWPTLGVPVPKGGYNEQRFRKHVEGLTDADLARLIVVAPMIDEATDTWGKAESLMKGAKRFGIDVKKIRAEAEAAAAKPAAEPKAKTSKKKAGKK